MGEKVLKNTLYGLVIAILAIVFIRMLLGGWDLYGIPYDLRFGDNPVLWLVCFLYSFRLAYIVAAIVGVATWLQQSFAALRQETAALRQQVCDLQEQLKKDD